MKKQLFIAALVGLAFTSCTSDNDESVKPQEQQKEIRFAAPVMYNISRATGEVLGTKYPKTEKFVVYGIKYSSSEAYPGWGEAGTQLEFPAEGSEVFPRTEAGNNDPTGWFPQFAHYYKTDFNYAFGAYSPSEFSTGVAYDNKKGLQITDFIPAALGQQIDLMYAPRVYNKNQNSDMEHGKNGNDFYDGINLSFKHALSSVHFRVCVDPRYKRAMDAAGYKFENGDFKIKSITMTNVKNKADFNENITNEALMDGKDVYAATPKWTTKGTTENYKFFDEPGYVDITLPTNTENTIAKAAKDITTMDGHYGLLIPQNIEGSGIKVIIEWQHRKWTDNDHFTLDDMKTEVILEDYMKDNKMWKQGIRYIYNIVFRENLIYFAPTIEDWTDVENDIFPDPDDSVIVP